jgi:hypothetical protein
MKSYRALERYCETASNAARLGCEIDGDELPGPGIEDGHESLLFCWRRRNA